MCLKINGANRACEILHTRISYARGREREKKGKKEKKEKKKRRKKRKKEEKKNGENQPHSGVSTFFLDRSGSSASRKRQSAAAARLMPTTQKALMRGASKEVLKRRCPTDPKSGSAVGRFIQKMFKRCSARHPKKSYCAAALFSQKNFSARLRGLPQIFLRRHYVTHPKKS